MAGGGTAVSCGAPGAETAGTPRPEPGAFAFLPFVPHPLYVTTATSATNARTMQAMLAVLFKLIIPDTTPSTLVEGYPARVTNRYDIRQFIVNREHL